MLVLPLAMAVVVSLALAPILIPRTMIWIGAPFVVLLAAAAAMPRWRALRLAVAAALTVVSLDTSYSYHRGSGKEPWRDFVTTIRAVATPAPVIVLVPGYSRPVLDYYLRAVPDAPTVVPVPFSASAPAPHLNWGDKDAHAAEVLMADGAVGFSTVWLLRRGNGDQEKVLAEHVLAEFVKHGRRVAGTWTGFGLLLIRLE
jgi:hypothetical protein